MSLTDGFTPSDSGKTALSDSDKKLSDYALFFDLLSTIAASRNEEEVFRGIVGVYNAICAPLYIAYLPFYGDMPGSVMISPRSVGEDSRVAGRLAGFDDEYGWTGSGKGFTMRISHAGEKLGIIEIEGVAFPEYREHYFNLAINSASVLGLAVSNARNYQELEEKNQALKKAKEQAEAATKLKDQFISLVAHDLRSPFNAMMGLLRLFVDSKPMLANEDDKKVLDSIFKSGDRMIDMIGQLLKISRLQTGKIVPQPRFFRGHNAAAVAIGSLGYAATQKGIEIINEVPPDMRLYADQSLFGEALLNLLSNAIKFCSRGDKITFFAPPSRPGVIAVRDTGRGIDEKRILDIFKHEVQTSTPGTVGELGTGLGLPYSRDIMLAHGGDITVESAPGEGSVFYAELPHVRPVALIVDDEVTARMLVRTLLERIGVGAIEVSDGKQALYAIKERRPHIIITDIDMPVMDGYDLLDRLKKDTETSGIPVIVMTAHNREMREKALRCGADDFVSKPIDLDDFIPRISRFVG
ncbi:MAG: response regulator [Nitrospinae bacterium]|nr:response regulator [Nitrospinota bacterium]MBF0633155.1 response regulator [Nitrospinota bacterium]